MELAELRQLTPRWKRPVFLAAAVGAVIVTSFGIESAGFLRAAGAVSTAPAYIATNMLFVLRLGRPPAIGRCIRAVWMLLLGRGASFQATAPIPDHRRGVSADRRPARIGADFMPSVGGCNSHFIWAALLCIAAALVWGVRLVSRVLILDTDK